MASLLILQFTGSGWLPIAFLPVYFANMHAVGLKCCLLWVFGSQINVIWTQIKCCRCLPSNKSKPASSDSQWYFCSSSVFVVLPHAQEVTSGPGTPACWSGGWCSALGDPPAAHADREGAGYSRQQSRSPGETPKALPSPSTSLTSYKFLSASTTFSSPLLYSRVFTGDPGYLMRTEITQNSSQVLWVLLTFVSSAIILHVI